MNEAASAARSQSAASTRSRDEQRLGGIVISCVLSQFRADRALSRFALVAGSGWLIDVVCLLEASRILPAGMANVVSSLTAAGFVYLISHRYVHAGQPSLIGLRLGLYGAYTLAMVLVASAALHWLTGVIAPHAPSALAILAAKIIITPPQFVCNFLMSRLVARVPLRAA